MFVSPTLIEGVKLIIPERFEDHRGSYTEIYDSVKFKDATGEEIKFVQDDVSISKKGVLRGLHGDVYAIIADNRPESKTYKRWQPFSLTGTNRHQLLLPPGVGNSVLALEDDLIYYYKQNTHFTDGRQFTIKWDDPEWKFAWPINNPILSRRDMAGDYIDDK